MPNSLSELHTLHAWEDNQITERCTQGEYAGKVLQFKLVDKDGAIDLTNCIVQYAVTRPDKTEDLLDCTVDNGVVKCNLTYSVTSVVGLVHGEVRVIGSNDSGIIKFYGVNLRVYKGVSDEVVEQSDEFSALTAALQKVVSIIPDPDSENTYVVRLDDSIVQNGLNPVASGTIYDFVTALTALDSTITDNGTKPVASGVIYDYLTDNFYAKTESDNKFQTIANKIQTIDTNRQTTTQDAQQYPSVAAVKEFLYANFMTEEEIEDYLGGFYTQTEADNKFALKSNTYTKSEINAIQTENDKRFELQTTVGFDESGIPVFISDNNSFNAGSCTVNNIKTLFIGSNVRLLQSGAFTTNSTGIEVVFIDNEQSDIAIQSGALPDGATIYYKGQFNALGFVIVALKNLSTSKLDDANNSVKTNHIANLNVTEGKLSSELQAKINRTTGVYSYTIPASNWSNNAQSLNLSSVYTVTSKTKVDIEGDDTVLEQLVTDDCEGIYVENNNGSLTIKAITNAPTENITVQLVVYEVEDLN